MDLRSRSKFSSEASLKVMFCRSRYPFSSDMASFSFPFSDGDQDQEDLRRRPQRPVHTRGRQELLRTVWKGKKERKAGGENGKMELF